MLTKTKQTVNYTYRGQPFKILKFYEPALTDHGFSRMCLYLIIPNFGQNLDEIEAKFEDGNWHGGITYIGTIQTQSKYGGEIRAIEIGCDYSHACDINVGWDFYTVLHDAKRLIDDLINKKIIIQSGKG